MIDGVFELVLHKFLKNRIDRQLDLSAGADVQPYFVTAGVSGMLNKWSPSLVFRSRKRGAGFAANRASAAISPLRSFCSATSWLSVVTVTVIFKRSKRRLVVTAA